MSMPKFSFFAFLLIVSLLAAQVPHAMATPVDPSAALRASEPSTEDADQGGDEGSGGDEETVDDESGEVADE